MLNESSTGASTQDGPGVEDGLTSRDFGPSFFTSIVEAFNHFPGHDIMMFFFHLRWHWENHQHRVNPVSADGIEIREGICTGYSALIVWIQGDRGKEICSTCQIDCLTLSSCGTDGYQRNIWRVFGQHSTISDVVQPAGQFVLPNLETHRWGIPQLAGWFHMEHIQPKNESTCGWFMMIYDDLWWFMMIYDDLWWFMMIYDDLWWFMMIYDDLWWFMMIYDDLWWFMMIYDDLWWFMMIYDDLWWFMMIYDDLWWFIWWFKMKFMIYDDLWWFMMIYDDLWWFMMIYDDLYGDLRWNLWWFMMIYDDLWWFMMIYDDLWWFMMIYMVI